MRWHGTACTAMSPRGYQEVIALKHQAVGFRFPLGKLAEFGHGRVTGQMQSMQIPMRWKCTG